MKTDFRKNYQDFVDNLKATLPRQMMSIAVGSNFDYVGSIEKQFLVKIGLKPTDYVIDVGCGSGRLTKQLAPFITSGKYLGTDIIPELLDNARNITPKSNFRFELSRGFNISEDNNQADYVVLFSVFSHLLEQEIYCYLREIKRVLKGDGTIVFSFLEHTPFLWPHFESEVDNLESPHPLNIFTSREAINLWAEHLDMKVINYFDADKVLVENMVPAMLDNGAMHNLGILGQAVCVMKRK